MTGEPKKDEEVSVEEQYGKTHTVNVEEEKARDPVGRLGNS